MPGSRQIALAFEWLMALLALLVIPALVMERRAPTPEIRTAALILNWVIWLAFVVEFVVRSGRGRSAVLPPASLVRRFSDCHHPANRCSRLDAGRSDTPSSASVASLPRVRCDCDARIEIPRGLSRRWGDGPGPTRPHTPFVTRRRRSPFRHSRIAPLCTWSWASPLTGITLFLLCATVLPRLVSEDGIDMRRATVVSR